MLVLGHEGRGNLLSNDAAEEAVVGHLDLHVEFAPHEPRRRQQCPQSRTVGARVRETRGASRPPSRHRELVALRSRLPARENVDALRRAAPREHREERLAGAIEHERSPSARRATDLRPASPSISGQPRAAGLFERRDHSRAHLLGERGAFTARRHARRRRKRTACHVATPSSVAFSASQSMRSRSPTGTRR